MDANSIVIQFSATVSRFPVVEADLYTFRVQEEGGHEEQEDFPLAGEDQLHLRECCTGWCCAGDLLEDMDPLSLFLTLAADLVSILHSSFFNKPIPFAGLFLFLYVICQFPSIGNVCAYFHYFIMKIIFLFNLNLKNPNFCPIFQQNQGENNCILIWKQVDEGLGDCSRRKCVPIGIFKRHNFSMTPACSKLTSEAASLTGPQPDKLASNSHFMISKSDIACKLEPTNFAV